jgi:hypothetical protein
MKIFKELNKLGYKHYTENTVEELDDIPLDTEERIMEQALVLRWFRESHTLSSWVYNGYMDKYFYTILRNGRLVQANESVTTYEEAELACLKKLIELSTPITKP